MKSAALSIESNLHRLYRLPDAGMAIFSLDTDQERVRLLYAVARPLPWLFFFIHILREGVYVGGRSMFKGVCLPAKPTNWN